MINKIILNSEIAAIHIPKEITINSGIEFVTEVKDEFQLGFMSRKKGYEISPHYHDKVNRNLSETSEVLFIKKGKIKCDFFNQNNLSDNKSIILNKGDILLIFKYGHSFKMIEDSEIIEIKQGPFKETKKILSDTR